MAPWRRMLPLVVIAFSALFLSQVMASTLGVGEVKQLASGERFVPHGYVVFQNVTLVSRNGGMDDSGVDRVYFTAYVMNPLDEGYYYVRVKLVNDGNNYIATGRLYLTTTPKRFYFNLGSTIQQDDKVRVILDAKKLG